MVKYRSTGLPWTPSLEDTLVIFVDCAVAKRNPDKKGAAAGQEVLEVRFGVPPKNASPSWHHSPARFSAS